MESSLFNTRCVNIWPAAVFFDPFDAEMFKKPAAVCDIVYVCGRSPIFYIRKQDRPSMSMSVGDIFQFRKIVK